MSDYKHKEGAGTLFPNEYKKEDKHPDWRGSGTTLDGKKIEIAAWKGETREGKPKLGLTFSWPREQEESNSEELGEKEEDSSFPL